MLLIKFESNPLLKSIDIGTSELDHSKKVFSSKFSRLDKISFSTFKKQKVPRTINLKSDERKTLKFLKSKIQKKYFVKLVKMNEFYKRNVLKEA